FPTPTLSETGTLPSGVTFVDNHNGTGTLSGTPASGTAGTYSITFTASNNVGTPATQAFTVTVNNPSAASAITSASSTTFTVGATGTFSVTTTGTPTPTLTETGTLPSGVTFVDNHNGTGTLSGIPASGTAGTYSITFTANNGVGTPTTQTFTVTVNNPGAAPVITGGSHGQNLLPHVRRQQWHRFAGEPDFHPNCKSSSRHHQPQQHNIQRGRIGVVHRADDRLPNAILD